MKSYITISKRQAGKPFPHYFSNCVGAGRAKEGLRADWQRQLKECIKDCGFSYLRFHGLLCDDMGVYRIVDGEEKYNFQYIDELFDSMLAMGIKPFVEFGFMPEALASGETTIFWWKGNSTPPKDGGAWARLVKKCVEHWIGRYGIEEVLTWYFEIWNEPNLSGFWNGTKSQYFYLYEISARVIKEVDERLRVGGPATSNYVPDGRFDGEIEDKSKQMTHMVEDLDSLKWHGTWISDFLKFAEEKQLPVDFISTHPYPTDFALDGHNGKNKGRTRKKDSLKEDIDWLKKTIAKSAYPNVEIHLTEWSSSPSSRDYSHDYLPAADYIVKSNIDCVGLVDSLSYWVFTDVFEEAGPGPECFHGGFGLLNLQGIKKPAYHAYRFLHALGDKELLRTKEGIVTKGKDDRISALFYNYADELSQAVPMSVYPDRSVAEQVMGMGETIQLHLEIDGMKPNTQVLIEIVDEDHGTAVTGWKNMGYPENLTLEQLKELQSMADGVQKIWFTADEEGKFVCDIEQKPWALVFLQEQNE